MAHWRYTVAGLLVNRFREAKALRLRGGIKFARRELGISKGAVLDAGQAQKIGEIIEAHRVVWGSYWREDEQWQVRAFVLNVAGGKASPELTVASADWFEVGDKLTEQVLRELRIEPSEEERQEMSRRSTTSPIALEWFSKALALQEEAKPLSEQEASARKAIAADPQCARAYGALAATLGSQGKFAEAEEAVRQALKIRPDSADIHATLGFLLLHQKKSAEAEQEFRQAHHLDPDDSRSLDWLGQLYTTQGKWDEAIALFNQARLLAPMDASIHANLGRAYVHKRNREKAMEHLKEAERLLDPEGLGNINAEQMICQAYELLGEIPLAVQHYEGFITLAQKEGLNPKMVSAFEKMAQRLRATLTPTTLQAALAEKLTEDELNKVVNPVAGSAEIKRWARQLTEGADSDLDKARVLFEGLRRRIQLEGGGRARTALEVFAAWSDPNELFSCQEYAKLFIALARDVGLEAFCVHVEEDYRGKVVYHDCAVVFAQGNALLVDPAYRWFGVPHKEFVLMDDVQTIAHHFFQGRRTGGNVSRCRLAEKLHPDFAWGQLRLANALLSADQTEEARKVLEVASGLEPGRWDAYLLRGLLAGDDGNWQAAAGYFRKTLELNAESARAHFGLAGALLAQGKVEQAREEYRACLRYKPQPNVAGQAHQAIAQINEKIGVDQTLPADVTPESQYDLAISQFTKAIEADPENAQAYSDRGNAYGAQGQYAKAIADLNKALEIDPDNALAYFNRGNAYGDQGQYDRAISDFNKAIEMNPSDEDAYNYREAAYRAKARSYLAVSDYTRAIETNPKDVSAYIGRGIAYSAEEKYERAIPDFSKALEINAKDAGAYCCRARAYVGNGKYDQAIMDCNQAIEICPRLAQAYCNRALACTKKGEYDRAISDCNKALEIDPRLPDAYRNRGFAHQAKGEHDQASSDFNKFQKVAR
jgi:tetratricopeptide (TPR) repeat protein